MIQVIERVGTEEAREFAASVAAIVRQAARPERWAADPWRPGAAVSDADPALEDALRTAGWEELGRDEGLLPLAAPAAAALGRGFASLAPVDRLLGEALKVGTLARYAQEGAPLVEPRAAALLVTRAGRLSPLPYTDSLGVARVEVEEELETDALGVARVEADDADDAPGSDRAAGLGPAAVSEGDAGIRMAAWIAASTGYLAGLAEEALRLALEHARSRRAFGGPLTALEPVQQMLADAATLADGLSLLTADSPGPDALAHAGEAAERAVAICMQVTGALGFTMEFPLQRAYRRSRSARTWADAVLAAWESPAA